MPLEQDPVYCDSWICSKNSWRKICAGAATTATTTSATATTTATTTITVPLCIIYNGHNIHPGYGRTGISFLVWLWGLKPQYFAGDDEFLCTSGTLLSKHLYQMALLYLITIVRFEASVLMNSRACSGILVPKSFRLAPLQERTLTSSSHRSRTHQVLHRNVSYLDVEVGLGKGFDLAWGIECNQGRAKALKVTCIFTSSWSYQILMTHYFIKDIFRLAFFRLCDSVTWQKQSG